MIVKKKSAPKQIMVFFHKAYYVIFLNSPTDTINKVPHLKRLIYSSTLPLLVFVMVMTSITTLSSLAIASVDEKTIVMFVPDTDWPPYLVNDPNYPGGGVLVEVLKTIATPLGYTIITKRLPNKRGWFLLNNHDVDVHAKALEWVPNPDDYLWTDIFMLNEDVLLLSADNTFKYTVPESLFGKNVAAIEGFIYPVLEEHFASGKIVRTNVASPFAMLELLALGRVDAALVNKSGTEWLFKTRPDLKPERFRVDQTPIDSAGYRYIFCKDKNWQPFINDFNKALKTMKKNGKLKTILDKYK